MSSSDSAPRFRFSLRWLLVFVAVIALVLGLFSFRAGQVLAIWLVLALLRGVVPTMALVGAVFGGGDWRAFSLGAMVACLPLVVEGPGAVIYNPLGAGVLVGGQLFYVAVCGVLAVSIRRWLVRQGLANDR